MNTLTHGRNGAHARSGRKVPSGGYTAKDAAGIAGISYRQIDYWDREGVLHPSMKAAEGAGRPREYSREDVLTLRVMKELTGLGVSLRLLSLVGETVRGCVNVEDLKDRQWLIIGSNGTVGLHNSGDLATVLAAHGGSAWVLDLNKVVEETAV